MQTKHDFNKPECPGIKLEKLATHSNGTVFYACRNCGYAGKSESFTEPFHASQILQQRQ
jgi:hypothetical protein